MDIFQRTIVHVSEPHLSVILPIFNCEKYLQASLDSLLSQSFKDFEIIAVDDASTDGSWAILSSCKDPRVRHFRNKDNLGVAKTSNIAASFSRGELIARMDADDVCDPERFKRQIEAFRDDKNLVLLGTSIINTDENGEFINELSYPLNDIAIKAALRVGSPFAGMTVMMRKDKFIQAGGYRDFFRLAEDYDLWLRISELGRMANLYFPSVFVRNHLSSLTLSKGGEALAYHKIAQQSWERRQLGQSDFDFSVGHQGPVWEQFGLDSEMRQSLALQGELDVAKRLFFLGLNERASEAVETFRREDFQAFQKLDAELLLLQVRSLVATKHYFSALGAALLCPLKNPRVVSSVFRKFSRRLRAN